MAFTPADQLAVDTIRTLSMDAVQRANSGHPGAPMGLAPLGWVLFSKLRKHAPGEPEWFDRDRFVLSCGHASMLQYSLLHLTGYELSLSELKNFRQWNSKTPGHPEVFHTPGVETTTGPLGQGFSNAVGMAMAERHLAERFNKDGHTLVDHHTWVLASDGDLMEGVAAEAASLAGHLKLGKLIVFWDDNNITIDGKAELSCTEDVLGRFAAYGWHTLTVDDGNDLQALFEAGEAAKTERARPTLVRVRTIIAYPSPNKQGTSSSHGAPLGDEEIEKTKSAMGWSHEPFFVPEEVRALGASIKEAGEVAYESWQAQRRAHAEAAPDSAAAFSAAITGTLGKGWDATLPSFDADPKGMASRKASGDVLQALSVAVPTLIGGSADLAGSNNSTMKDAGFFGTDVGGRNIHWGIREHAMASASNGMALHGGVLPFTATFLVFSDYMRPAIRLAALMGLPVKYVFTHDSIGLGEDGPTHQPVEHLAALRAIPGLTVLRPADANEVREAWKVMIRAKGPCAIVLSRQSLPTLERSSQGAAEGVQKGAYVLRDAQGTPDLILMASGSEVAVALEAADVLQRSGKKVRVVSMASHELFAAQDPAYREHVLPASVGARVAVEAGIRMGWDRWLGDRGDMVSLEHFGASAPAEKLFAEFGFTSENVVACARRVLA